MEYDPNVMQRAINDAIAQLKEQGGSVAPDTVTGILVARFPFPTLDEWLEQGGEAVSWEWYQQLCTPDQIGLVVTAFMRKAGMIQT